MTIFIEPQRPILWADGGIKLALVGEAPDAEEEAVGKVFQGASGRELDKWISAARMFRSQLFIGNLSRKRPPKNDLSAWISKDGTPTSALAEDIELLISELKELKPNAIVTLGRYPLQILTGQDKVFNWWGSVIEAPRLPGIKIIPLPHPAFVIKGMWRLRPICATFMQRAKAESLTPNWTPDNRTRLIFPSIDETLFHLDRLTKKSSKVCLDIEDPPPFSRLTCIGFSDSADWSICIPFVRGILPYWTVSEEAAVIKAIDKLLRSDSLKIAHNLPYDFTKLAALGFFVAPPYWDTMLAHNRLFPDFSNKTLKKLKLNRLAFCTALYTQHKYYKEDYKVDNVGGPSPGGTQQSYFEYNCNDTMTTFEIQAVQEKEFIERRFLPQITEDMRCFVSMEYMSLKGVKRDEGALALLQQRVESALAENQKTMDKLAGTPVNTRSNKQLCNLLYTQKKLPAQWKKAVKKNAGQVLTADETALLKIKHLDQLVLHILFDRRLSKFNSTYLKSELRDGRTHTTYNNSRTSTFRLSSSGYLLGGGMNLQTIPARPRPGETFYNEALTNFKKTFVADAGLLMWKRDYKQAEAVYFAYDSEDLPLIDDFKNGIDIHCRTASYITGEDYQKIYSEYKNGNPIYESKRRFAKPVRHGSNYKMSWVKLQELFLLDGLVVAAAECKHAMAAVLEASPYTVQFHKKKEAQFRDRKVVYNAFGHPYKNYGVISDDEIREMLAFGPQSTIGLMTQYAAARVYESCETELLMNLHDCLVGQSPADFVLQHLEEVGRLMEFPLTLHGRRFIIESDAAYGSNWGALKKV